MNPSLAATAPLGQAVDDPNRLSALRRTGLLDSPIEETFDRFTRLASKLLNSPVSLVSLVDRDRQFFKSQIGLPSEVAQKRETPLTHSFCQHVVRGGSPLRIPDATLDPRVRQNLAIPDLGVIAYLGVPITSDDGMVLGSFCVIDGKVRPWSDEDLMALEDLGKALASEIRLRERTEFLRQNLTEREDADRGREQMLHMLVHDMRTPAGIVLSTLDLLDPPDSSDPEQLELLEMAKRSAHDLLAMLTEMLEVHRMKEGKPVLQLAPASINELLRDTFLEIHPLAESAQQLLQVSYPPGSEIFLQIDRRLLRRVLLNLITNACKYSPPGAKIHFWAEAGESGMRIIVEDNGPGIAPEEKARLFAPFAQGESGRKQAANSFGLGLAFCRLAIEAHGGTLWVEDGQKGGSRFVALIPVNSLGETSEAA